MMSNDDLQIFKNAIQLIYPELNEAEWHFIQKNAQVKHFKTKEYIIEGGQIQQNIGFICKGLVRGFYINDKGEEITMRFAAENSFVTHYSAFLQQIPSLYYFQCLQPTTIVNLSFTTIQEGYKTFKGLERFGRLIAEHILISQQQRIEDFNFLNAEQRYLKFINQHPDLFNRVSLSHLSTYLGIQRPSLSRIRKKLASQ